MKTDQTACWFESSLGAHEGFLFFACWGLFSLTMHTVDAVGTNV